ncbi:hypothetical protein PAJ34TS1_14760 [Paenibacillus azoreducens]|uniref:Uncharacterized protein n=1 Tax=Paenibacillus azoreducens TaxID=116718 RepID=A0A919YDM5_9BACL|nr:hypothetical protein J34TS1_13020 [Paenibacillus azoreducens]
MWERIRIKKCLKLKMVDMFARFYHFEEVSLGGSLKQQAGLDFLGRIHFATSRMDYIVQVKMSLIYYTS